MPDSTVLGPRNPGVTEAARLHRTRRRRETGETLIEGPHMLQEAVAAGVELRAVYATSDDLETFRLGDANGFEVSPVSEEALGKLSATKTPRGPIAKIPIPGDPEGVTGNLVVSVGVSEPGNLGALIRTAAAFKWDVAFTPGSADPWSPKTLRGGAGGHFRVRIVSLDDLEDLAAWTTVATVVEGGIPPAEVSSGPYAVLVGDEAAGIPPEVVRDSDVQVTIPMPGGTESLNAGVAAGIVVYELSFR